jgi:EmrB/QacA subfamily drug resistance transporter
MQVFAIVCIGIVLANLDLFIVNIGLPKIAEDFRDASLEELSWVLNGYAIAYAALLVFFGRLAEGYRRDRSFILGIGMFTAASAACAAAGGVWELVAFRVAQAAGAALMTPTSISLLLASFPPEQRGGAVRNWAGAGGFAAALGPLVGGVLVSIDWRWIFIVNVPIGVVAMGIAWWKLLEVPGHSVDRPSFRAALLVTGGISALIFALVKVNDWGWRSPEITISATVSFGLLTMFVLHCSRASNPFVDPALFRIRSFLGSVLAITPYSTTFGAMIFSVSLWGQLAWGWSALHAGLAFILGPLLVPTTSLLFARKLIERLGAAAVVTIGILSIVAGFVIWATFVGLEPNTRLIVVGMAFNGIGVGLAFPTLMGVSTHALPSSSFATGSGVINMIRQAAIAIGVAIFVAIIGSPASPEERLAAFRLGWWVMAAITALALIPTLGILNAPDSAQRSPSE